GVVSGVEFGLDGKSVLVGNEDGSVWLWDLASRRLLIPPLRHAAPVVGAFGPDGKTIRTDGRDGTARLWDAATGQSIGPILRQAGTTEDAAFIADGRNSVTAGRVARLFPLSPDLPDDLERVATWVEVITGLRLDKQGLVQVLDNAAWLARRERLMQ